MRKPTKLWLLWGTLSVAITLILSFALWGEKQYWFLPGKASHGHHQIERECELCHTRFGGVKNDACQKCHAAELKAADDSHPEKKFKDPRNADRLAALDALQCITCHQEHKPEKIRNMGVSLPDDFCYRCHADIGKERKTHRDLDFKSCASAGCHNYHDNTALYENFLGKHLHEANLLPQAVNLERNFGRLYLALSGKKPAALSRQNADHPASFPTDVKTIQDWSATAHAKQGVNCSDCHRNRQGTWRKKAGYEACKRCHDQQVAGFLGGMHGMRLQQNLSPMQPGLAQIPMKPKAAKHNLSCSSCHTAHRFDTRHAAVDACMTCHNDTHSRAYQRSKHYRLWQSELRGLAPANTGVSCATCHLPREAHQAKGLNVVQVQHNQNANLRPNEKMIRGICMQCHGLGFSLDALADTALIKNNFSSKPNIRVKSLEMTEHHLKTRRKPRKEKM